MKAAERTADAADSRVVDDTEHCVCDHRRFVPAVSDFAGGSDYLEKILDESLTRFDEAKQATDEVHRRD